MLINIKISEEKINTKSQLIENRDQKVYQLFDSNFKFIS